MAGVGSGIHQFISAFETLSYSSSLALHTRVVPLEDTFFASKYPINTIGLWPSMLTNTSCSNSGSCSCTEIHCVIVECLFSNCRLSHMRPNRATRRKALSYAGC